jgi:hypothetical protein
MSFFFTDSNSISNNTGFDFAGQDNRGKERSTTNSRITGNRYQTSEEKRGISHEFTNL